MNGHEGDGTLAASGELGFGCEAGMSISLATITLPPYDRASC
jgi:hypothetical protein